MKCRDEIVYDDENMLFGDFVEVLTLGEAGKSREIFEGAMLEYNVSFMVIEY